MKRMRLSTARKAGFSKKVIRTKKDLPRQTLGYMKQKSSFLLAAFSLAAFITGNMMGQHGWYAFWKAALGQYDDSLITYNGTVTPVAFVPDYSKWSTYGGDGTQHTYRQVPKDALIPLPPYNPKDEKKGHNDIQVGDYYPVGNMGSYATGAENGGSHIGVDIAVPEGTPVRAIANGIVTQVREDKGGFGKLIVIRHPHMPDPDNPDYETVLHSAYAHLSAQYVNEGDVVQKGQEIGLSGQTGFATGPHLHFQVDRDTAPWHPYWAFSYTEAREAGYTTTQAINAAFHQERGLQYTVHPLLLVQANYPAAKYKTEPGMTVVKKTTTKTATVTKVSTKRTVSSTTLATTANARKAARMAKIAAAPSVSTNPTPGVAAVTPPSVVESTTVVATQTQSSPAESAPVLVVPQKGTVSSIDIQSDRQYTGRGWETIRLTLLDESGRTVTEGLKKDIYMRTAYGEAEFDPPVLSPLDFKDGTATVKMLPRGRRTVVILIEPFKVMSSPIEYVEN